jgi:hypothetical protein
LIDFGSALQGRPRQWLADALIGGSTALFAITVAHAALPQPSHLSALRPVRISLPARAAAVAPPAPAALIAFSEPEPGRPIVSPFGLRRLPWEGGGRLHEGVDIDAPPGEPVLAAADGVVVRAGQDGGYGRFVEVKHAAGLSSFYAHLGAIGPGVAAGLAVKAGTPIGKIGDSGVSTGPHLHFEIRNADGHPLNPEYFLNRRFARLEDLPLGAAAAVPRAVRIAYVSRIPPSKLALMQPKDGSKAGAADKTDVASASGRPRARMQMQIPSVAALDDRRTLIAQIAAAQHVRENLQAAPPAQAAVGVAIDAVVHAGVDESAPAS